MGSALIDVVKNITNWSGVNRSKGAISWESIESRETGVPELSDEASGCPGEIFMDFSGYLGQDGPDGASIFSEVFVTVCSETTGKTATATICRMSEPASYEVLVTLSRMIENGSKPAVLERVASAYTTDPTEN